MKCAAQEEDEEGPAWQAGHGADHPRSATEAREVQPQQHEETQCSIGAMVWPL